MKKRFRIKLKMNESSFSSRLIFSIYLLGGILCGFSAGLFTNATIGIEVGIICSVVSTMTAQIYQWITHLEIEEIEE